jgi:hypothetical protein
MFTVTFFGFAVPAGFKKKPPVPAVFLQIVLSSGNQLSAARVPPKWIGLK